MNLPDPLDRSNGPIVITDVAEGEVLRGMPGALDAMVFRDWFRNGGNRMRTIETSVGLLWNALTPDQQTLRKRIKDAGETSIWQFSNTLQGTLGASDYGLLPFEGNQVMSVERMGMIPSAEALHRELSSAGRDIQRDPFERQAASAEADANWTDMQDMS